MATNNALNNTYNSITGYLQAPEGIKDANGNVVLDFTGVASAVNYIAISNNSTGNQPVFTALGTDAVVSISFQPKGDAAVQVLGTSARGGTFNLYENTGNGTNYMQLKCPEALAGTTTIYTFQENAATNYLTYDTTSTPDWTSFAGSVGFTGFSANPTGVVARYKKIGKTCFINISMSNGTSNATTFTITGLPFTSATGFTQYFAGAGGANNGAVITGNVFGFIATASTTITCALNGSGSGWTAANGKAVLFSFCYETA